MDRWVVVGDVRSFEITPGDAHVLYLADGDLDEVLELYSVDVAGPGIVVKLNPPLSGTRDVSRFALGLDGARALYLANQDSPGVKELYSVPVDGSASPVKLNGPMVAGGNVRPEAPAGGVARPSFLSAPLGRVLYVADQEQNGVYELYSVPADGSLAPVKLNPPLPTGIDVGWVRVATSGSRAVFDLVTSRVLYSVPVDGSLEAVRLTPRGNRDFGLDPTGELVIYVAEQEVIGRRELYSVPSDGSAPAVKLSGSLVTNGDVLDWVFASSPDGRILYRADQDSDDVVELYAVPSDGSAPPVKLNPALVAGGDVGFFALSPDGGRAAYQADQDRDGVAELYSVPSDGSAPAVKLNPTLGFGRNVWAPFAFSIDGSRIVYRAAQESSVAELYSVPSDGSAAPVKVSAPSAGVAAFLMRPGGGSVLYHSDYELFLAPLDASSAPVKINGTLPIGGAVPLPNDNYEFPTEYYGFANGGSFVAYLADQRARDRLELFRTILP